MWIQFPWLMLKSSDAGGVGGGEARKNPKTSQPYWQRKTVGDPYPDGSAPNVSVHDCSLVLWCTRSELSLVVCQRVELSTTVKSRHSLVTDGAPQSGFGMARTVSSPTHPRRARPSSSLSPTSRLSSTGGTGLKKDKRLDESMDSQKGQEPIGLRDDYRTGTGIFHGGFTDPASVGSVHAPLPFAVSKGQLKSRAAHSSAYPLDNREAKLMGDQVRREHWIGFRCTARLLESRRACVHCSPAWTSCVKFTTKWCLKSRRRKRPLRICSGKWLTET